MIETISPDPKINPVAVRVVQYATSCELSSARVNTRIPAGAGPRGEHPGETEDDCGREQAVGFSQCLDH